MNTPAIRSDFDCKFSGFRVLIYSLWVWVLGFEGLRVLGVVVLESKRFKPAQGFEHVEGYEGFAAGKPGVCS